MGLWFSKSVPMIIESNSVLIGVCCMFHDEVALLYFIEEANRGRSSYLLSR
ncbi:MAG: hypothetical protein WDA17_06755 [Sphaerochaetaceae bacterium]